MSNFRIILVVLLGVSLIQALPASKPTSKPTTPPRTKLSSRSASAPKTKTLATEEKKIGEEKAAEMAVEAAEEPATGGRKKKSTATTFCVEIRPTPNSPPNNICDPPARIPQPIPTTIYDQHGHQEQHDYVEHHEHHEHHEQPLQPSQPIIQDPPVFMEKQPIISFLPQHQQTVGCLEPQQPSIAYVAPPVAPCPCPCSPLQLISRFHSHLGGGFGRSNDMDDASAFSQSPTVDSQAPAYAGMQQPQSFPADTSDSYYTKALQQNTQQASMTGYQAPVADQAYLQQYSPGAHSSAMTNPGESSAAGSFRIEGPSFSGAVTGPQMNIELPQGRPRFNQPSFPMPSMLAGVPHTSYTAYPSSPYPSSVGYSTLHRNYDSYPTFPMNIGASPCNQQIRQQRQEQSDEPKNTKTEEKTNQSDMMMSPRQMLNKMRGNEPRRIISTVEGVSRSNENQSNDGMQINVNAPTSGQSDSAIDPLSKNKTNEEKSSASRPSDFGKREVEPSVNVIKT